MKTILFVRHSLPQKQNIENEKIPLSIEGIEKAKAFFQLPIFKQIDYIYSSTYLRSYQTACLLSKNIITDDRLIERLIGDSKTADKRQWKMQYDNHDYKNKNGESLHEVKQRMCQSVHDILVNMNENEVSVVVSHATSICSYLLSVCDITVINEIERIRRITFKDKVIFEDKMNKPSCFVVQYKNNQIIDISYFSS